MPEPQDSTLFPAFPTLFTEDDAARLKNIREQKRRMEQIYKAKFEAPAWAKTSPIERGLRQFIEPTFIEPIVQAVTPWQWGLDFGMTPQDARENRDKVVKEYDELSRREKVTRVLPSIQDSLRIFALMGQLNPNLEEELTVGSGLKLGEYYKMDELEFSEEEKGFVTAFAKSLIGASEEDIISGDTWKTRPFSQEEAEKIAKQPSRSPTLASISFEKDAAEVRAAFLNHFPSNVETPLEEMKKRALDSYLRSIGAKEGESLETATQRFLEETVAKEGKVLTLVDEASGDIVAGRLMPDKSVFVKDELIGFRTETGTIIEYDFEGKPTNTDESIMGKLRTIWNGWSKSSNQVGFMAEQFFSTQIPLIIAKDQEAHIDRRVTIKKMTPEEAVIARQELKKTISSYNQKYAVNQTRFELWLEKHPELKPKPYYDQPILDTELRTWKWGLLKDPAFVAYKIVSNAPTTVAALGVGLLSGLATKNPLIAATTSAAFITPVQIQEIQDSMVANGATPDEAVELSTTLGMISGAVEVFPSMLLFRNLTPVFSRILMKNIREETAKELVKSLSRKGALGKSSLEALKIIGSEEIEEALQLGIEAAAVRTVNENSNLLTELPETMLQTLLSTIPLGLLGGTGSYMNLRYNMPADFQAKMDETKSKYVEAGLSESHAEAATVAKVMETELGQALIMDAVEQAEVVTLPFSVEELETSDVIIDSSGILYRNERAGVSIKAKNWEELDRKLKALRIPELSPADVEVRFDQIIYRDKETGEQIVAKSFKELNDKLLERNKAREARSIEELWDEMEDKSLFGKRAATVTVETPKATVQVKKIKKKAITPKPVITPEVPVEEQPTIPNKPSPSSKLLQNYKAKLKDNMEALAHTKAVLERQEARLENLTMPNERAEQQVSIVSLKAQIEKLENSIRRYNERIETERKKVKPVTQLPPKPNDEIGQAIASELGTVTYDGIQPGFADIPDKFQFTDSETGSTFLADNLEEAKSKLLAMREKFRAAEPTVQEAQIEFSSRITVPLKNKIMFILKTLSPEVSSSLVKNVDITEEGGIGATYNFPEKTLLISKIVMEELSEASREQSIVHELGHAIFSDFIDVRAFGIIQDFVDRGNVYGLNYSEGIEEALRVSENFAELFESFVRDSPLSLFYPGNDFRKNVPYPPILQDFFKLNFPRLEGILSAPSIQESSYRKVGNYEVMTDKDGRTIICA